MVAASHPRIAVAPRLATLSHHLSSLILLLNQRTDHHISAVRIMISSNNTAFGVKS